MSCYQNISTFVGEISMDPLEYCLIDGYDAKFKFGSQAKTFGKYNRQCGIYMSNRCSQNWDNVCEALSLDTNASFPDMTNNIDGSCNQNPASCSSEQFLKTGEILVKDTAYMKYLLNANGCNVKCEPFDPTVADSPSICYISRSNCSVGQTNINSCGILNNAALETNYSIQCGVHDNGKCEKRYGLTDAQIRNIDSDPVMCKLMAKPYIAPDLLTAIYMDAKSHGYAIKLRGTLLGRFYEFNGMAL